MTRTIAGLILLLCLNRIAYSNYATVFSRDLSLEITALGLKNTEATACNVRVSDISVNGTSIDLSKIPLENGWDYLKEEDFIYIYNLHSEAPIHINLDDVRTLDITFVTEVGSGKVKVSIDGKIWNWLDLYSNSEWNLCTCSYDTSIFVHPEKHPSIILGAILILLLISVLAEIILPQRQIARATKMSRSVILLTILTTLVYLDILIIQYKNIHSIIRFFSNGYLYPLYGFIIIFLLATCLYELVRHFWITYGFLAGVTELLVVISESKVLAKGTPLLPWDYQMMKEALSVMDGYEFSISGLSFIIILSTVVVTIAMYLYRGSVSGKEIILKEDRLPDPRKLLKRVCACAIPAAVFVYFVCSTLIHGEITDAEKYRVYKVADYYDLKSFPVAFTEYIGYMMPEEEPDGYSRKSMDYIASKIIDRAEQQNKSKTKRNMATDELPNIIVIMSESFWDINRLKTVSFEEDPIPVFHALQKEALHGQLFSHVFGGNTVVSEYEFLTGMDGIYFPPDYMVYGEKIVSQDDSAVSILESMGYETLAIHPYIKSNYNRNAAYEILGFDRFLSEEDFPEDLEYIRNYISDKEVFRKIEQECAKQRENSDNPFFIMAVTMQNHGGYWGNSLYEPAQISFSAKGYDETTIACMNDYFAGLHASDQALQEMIDYFRRDERETVIVVFGDHMSDCGSKSEKMLSLQGWQQNSEVEYDYQTHIVPFLIWNNKDKSEEDLGMMQINQLFPMVFDRLGMPMPYYWEYLLERKKQYLAVDSLMVLSTDMVYKSFEEMTQEQKDGYKTNQILQYDYIYGHRYAEKLWELNIVEKEDGY